MLGLYDPVPAKTNEKSFWLLKNFLETHDLNCSAHESPWIMTFDCPSPTSSNIKDVHGIKKLRASFSDTTNKKFKIDPVWYSS